MPWSRPGFLKNVKFLKGIVHRPRGQHTPADPPSPAGAAPEPALPLRRSTGGASPLRTAAPRTTRASGGYDAAMFAAMTSTEDPRAPARVERDPYVDRVRDAVRAATGGLDAFPLTQQMLPQYEGETEGAHPIRYLRSAEERAPYEVRIEDGRFRFRASGAWLDTGHASRGAARALGVMAPDGRIYVSTRFDADSIRHSSFLGGAPVAAGFTLTASDGRALATSRRTGHYRTSQQAHQQFIRFINVMGVTGNILIEPLE